MKNDRIFRIARRAAAALLVPFWIAAAGAAEAPKKYEYGTSAKVIDIGYGVLATPMSVIGEVLRRDRILRGGAEKAGLEMRFHAFEKGLDTLPALVDGRLDASMPTDVVALDAIARTDVVLAGYVRQSFSTVVGPKTWRIADLKGKRVGNAAGTSGHNALLQGLDGAGLSEADLTLVQMNVRDMPEALLAGRIDAFAAFEPTPSSMLKNHGERFAALHRQISPAYFVLTRRLTTTQPEAARLLVAALHRAVRWLHRSRDNVTRASRWTLSAMRDFTGREPTTSEREVIQLTRSDLLDIAGAPRIPVNEAEPGSALWRSFEFFRRSGKLPAGLGWPKVQAAFDRELTAEILQNARRYRIDEFDYAQ